MKKIYTKISKNKNASTLLFTLKVQGVELKTIFQSIILQDSSVRQKNVFSHQTTKKGAKDRK